jgi:hypothetical protein
MHKPNDFFATVGLGGLLAEHLTDDASIERYMMASKVLWMGKHQTPLFLGLLMLSMSSYFLITSNEPAALKFGSVACLTATWMFLAVFCRRGVAVAWFLQPANRSDELAWVATMVKTSHQADKWLSRTIEQGRTLRIFDIDVMAHLTREDQNISRLREAMFGGVTRASVTVGQK